MKMYMQWSKDGGYTSSSQTLIIPRLPRFEKLFFSKFQLYIESERMHQCFVCHNCKDIILVRAAEGKEKVFCILHTLRIHTGLWKWSKRNLFELHILKMNLFDIHVPCINIAKRELLFEQYIMAVYRDKYYIEV